MIVAWVLSFLFSAPILHFYDTSEIEGYGTQCWIDFDEQWKWRLYMTLVSVTLFVIPAFLIGGCYIVIVVTIWRKGKDMHHGAATATGASGGGRSLLQANRCASNASTASEILFKRRGRDGGGLISRLAFRVTHCVRARFANCNVPRKSSD